jgi:hypothetical protein
MGKQSVVCAIVFGLIVVLAIPASAPGGEAMRVTVDANSLSVDAGAARIAEYRFGDVPFKPYIKELFTPNGLNVLLDAPHDHLHHHALMFAVAVDGVNFWEETPTAGRQKHDLLRHVTDDAPNTPAVTWAEGLDWLDPTGKKLLGEMRLIHVARRTPPGPTVLSWESRLSAPGGKPSVTLTGSHYFGLGLRFIRAMDARGTFRNADNQPGTVFRGEERLVRSDWCAYTASVDGREVTVAMLGHPSNPRHPTTWFTMAKPFAYLSATLGLHEKPLEITEGKPLRLRYAVVLWDRPVDSEEITRLCQWWQSRPVK